MAAAAGERLFALELLVDWVRLDGPPPRAPGPAVAFRLLDFPPLLVRPPAPPPRRGAIGFGRGKACVFRARPAALRRPLLRAALLTLPPGPEPHPGPAPRLLGACDFQLACGAEGPGRGRRATLALRDPAGRRVGDVALFYRLTDLGEPRPGPAAAGTRSSPSPAPEAGEPLPEDANASVGASDIPAAPQAREEGGVYSEASGDRPASAESGGTGPAEACSAASPLSEDGADLELEANTFCPPPLYYTHITQGKTPPARVTITIEPQRTALEDMPGALQEESCVSPPTRPSPLKHTNSATQESPPMRVNPPRDQDAGAVSQTPCPPPADQSTVNTLRQLPLLNALLIELSLLYNQPVASPTQVHPHLAWLYKTEDKKASESSTQSSWQSASKKDKLSMEEPTKSVSLQCEKNQAENLKKGKHFEKNTGSPPKRVTKGRLLYGLTNTLRLRLKQTNPDMLVVHERREQYRKMQSQPLGTKLRIPSSKVKVLGFAEQSQKPHPLPRDKYTDSDASFAENTDTSGQISGFIDEPSTTKVTKLKCAAECGGNRTSNAFVKGIVSPANSVTPERLTHTSVLGGELERKTQSPCVFQQDAIVDRTVREEVDDRQAKATDNGILAAGRRESRPSKNSWHESVPELEYSDDFTSSCYSEDFYTPEDTSRSFRAGSSPGAGSPDTSKSSGARMPRRKSSEKTSVLSPPFSAGSPVLSQKRSHISKTRGKSWEEASSSSTSSLCSSHWTEEKGSQIDRNSVHHSEAIKRGHDCHVKPESGTGCKGSEKSQSSQTSQVSSYLPSNLSELELKVLEGSTSDHLEEDDDVGSLRISKQCKDICELVMNKLPGYTV